MNKQFDDVMIMGNINMMEIEGSYIDNVVIMQGLYNKKCIPPNTLYVAGEDLSKKNECTIYSQKSQQKIGKHSFKDIFFNRKLIDDFAAILKSRLNIVTSCCSTQNIVPLFYLINYDDDIHIYSQMRYSQDDIIFIKIAIEKDESFNSVLEILKFSIDVHNKNRVFLENHQCYYRKEDSSQEIEYKFNVIGSAEPWSMINDIYNDVEQGKLKNFIFEYKDEFQKWDYMNYMFKIYGDKTQKGYISFIPQTNGRYLIKRKLYNDDQLSRTEIHYKNVEIKMPLRDYIEREFNVEYKEFPPFRRVRYDINIECINHGNVHGIFFDRITVGGEQKQLVQCEIEYLRTRSLYSNNQYQNELDYLRDYMKSFFGKYKINYVETFYSKLSFMEELFGVTR